MVKIKKRNSQKAQRVLLIKTKYNQITTTDRWKQASEERADYICGTTYDWFGYLSQFLM